MKKRILLFLLPVLFVCVSLDVFPTAIRIGLWRDPHTGCQIIGIGDVHLPSKFEKEHRDFILNHVSTKERSHLAVEDVLAFNGLEAGSHISKFLPGMVAEALSKKIDAASLEFRYGICSALECPKRTGVLLEKCKGILLNLPVLFQEKFDALYKQVQELDVTAQTIAKKVGTPSYSSVDYYSFNDDAESLEMEVFNYYALSYVVKKIPLVKSLYVGVGDDHLVFLASCFKELGFKEVYNSVSYEDDDKLFDDFIKDRHIDSYAIDVKAIVEKIDSLQ